MSTLTQAPPIKNEFSETVQAQLDKFVETERRYLAEERRERLQKAEWILQQHCAKA